MQTLDSTIVNTALPSIAESISANPLRMESAIIGYSLAMAVGIPASGWMADRFGTRTIFQAAMILFVFGSLLCACAPTLPLLTAARVIQGSGGAMLLPIGRLAILRVFPRERYLHALNFVAVPAMIGPLVGPALGGWLTQLFSWHWIFLINVPIGVIGVFAASRYMPDVRMEVTSRFDGAGYALLTLAMVSLSFSLDRAGGGASQWLYMLGLLAVSASALVAFWLHSRSHKEPLFSPDLFTINAFRVGLLGNLFARIGNGAMPMLIPLALQIGLSYSPLDAGLMMVPVSVAGMAMKRVATHMIHRHGYRRVLEVNTFVVGLTIGAFAMLSPGWPVALTLLQLSLFGALNSIQFAAMNAVTLKDLSGAGASGGNSLLSMVQMLSMSLAVSVAGALLAAYPLVTRTQHGSDLCALQGTFMCLALLTCCSAWIFTRLTPEHR